MSATYEVFLVVLVIVAASGLLGVPKRLGIGDRSLQQAGPLTAVITSMTAAGLLSLAFLADKFVDADGEMSLLDGELSLAGAAVLLLLLTCISGLLCALTGLVLFNSSGMRRWAGGCLAVSSLAVAALSPAVIALIMSSADAALATGSG